MDGDEDVDVAEYAIALREEAAAENERRVLLLVGPRERGYDALESILSRLAVGISETVLVGPEDRLRCEHVPHERVERLLGTTQTLAIVDAHDRFEPNVLGSVVGAVDGGGLLVLLAPALEIWPDSRDGFDESIAIPPFDLEDVTGNFRRRFVDTCLVHRGVAVVDLTGEEAAIRADGLTNPPPKLSVESSPPSTPPAGVEPTFPTGADEFSTAAYEACYTRDQADALAAFESLASGGGDPSPPRAVVLESDRGRGKSSTAGLAAGCLAADGEDVLVTAPASRNVEELFARARELLARLGVAVESDRPEVATESDRPGVATESEVRTRLETTTGGSIRYLDPTTAIERAESADVVLVDEAAALPVAVLGSLLVADRIAFSTTIHGYEGAGRGFSVRFRDRLAASDHDVTAYTLTEPIRYAAGDPVEVWAFNALLLDARPPVDGVVSAATTETVTYRRLDPDDLLDDETLLRETFGLLVLAHYRTEPNDLARLLDAPNLSIRALCFEGRPVSVALFAREGNLESDDTRLMYEGGRIRGNMLPDVLTSQLRDERAGELAGIRIVRIATHHAVRLRGLGSQLLGVIRREFEPEIDWLGAGFGATPGLVDFWAENGYATVHVSTTRNDASGEHSAIVLAPTGDRGEDLASRHGRWFARRVPAVCSDALADLDPDVIRAVLRSVDASPALELTDHEWRVVAGAAYGPGLFDVDPGPFRRLIVRYLVDDPVDVDLPDRAERLLVLRGLQARSWADVAEQLEYPSTRTCMRAFGDALAPIVDAYGTEVARDLRERFLDE